MQTISSKLLRAEKLTSDVYHYEFDFGGPFLDFIPGQFFMLKVEDGQTPPVNRSYSIASAPSTTEHFALCIKLVEGGRASEYLRGLSVGDHVEFMGPVGHFTLKDREAETVMVATGTGLAPFMGMIPTLFERGFKKPITLLYGCRHEEDLFYLDQLKAWEAEHENFKAVVTLSRPGDNWQGETGRVTEHFDALDLDPEDSIVYICGNGDMVIDIKNRAEAKGLDKKSIALEQFTSATPKS